MLLIEDQEDNVYCVYYPAVEEDIYSEAIIGCVGYPIGFSSYENQGNYRTKCPIILIKIMAISDCRDKRDK